MPVAVATKSADRAALAARRGKVLRRNDPGKLDCYPGAGHLVSLHRDDPPVRSCLYDVPALPGSSNGGPSH